MVDIPFPTTQAKKKKIYFCAFSDQDKKSINIIDGGPLTKLRNWLYIELELPNKFVSQLIKIV